MSLFTEDRLLKRLQRETIRGFSTTEYDRLSKANTILNETLSQQRTFSAIEKEYDIFLSHSSTDAALVAGLKLELGDLGFSVYVDWIEDPKLNRNHVTKDTALLLQKRMRQSRSLIYAFSENATTSKWMPWELGYFDGIKQTAAVLPISKTEKSSFSGSEYLGIYHYIQIAKTRDLRNTALWVHETQTSYERFENWLLGFKPKQR